MVAQGEGRSPMTSSDAETDSKPIIIIIIYYGLTVTSASGLGRISQVLVITAAAHIHIVNASLEQGIL